MKETRRNISKTWILSFVLLFLVMFASGCREYQMKSQWKDREIRIDGDSSDWTGLLGYVEQEGVSIGVLNDGEFLYICFISENQARRMQVMNQGLTVWFDPHGKKDKVLGIRYPLGMSEEDRAKLQERRTQQDQSTPEKKRPQMRRPQNEVEILIPGKDLVQTVPFRELAGIQVRMDRQSTSLTYELRIPLKSSKTYPYAVDSDPSHTISFGIEIPKMDRVNRAGAGGRGSMGGGRMPGGGGIGGGGMRGGSMGGGKRGGSMGGRGGMQGQMSENLKVWIALELAAQSK
ncbi:hypothetical protein ACFLT9_13735 [Acidobacteriota bacterium]